MSGTLQPPRKQKAFSKPVQAKLQGGAADASGDSEAHAVSAMEPGKPTTGIPVGNKVSRAQGSRLPTPPGPGLPPSTPSAPPGMRQSGNGPQPPPSPSPAPAPAAGNVPSGGGASGPPTRAAPPGGAGGPNPAMLAQFAQGVGAPPRSAGPVGANGMRPEEMAAMGRNGDALMAHMTPGEIAIPPQLQSPQLLQLLQQLFAAKGVDLRQFIAGSPGAQVNPATGQEQFSFLGGLAPEILGLLGGGLGSLVAPGIGTALGAGLGSGVGSAVSGGSAAQDALAALGGGLGGYLSGAGNVTGGIASGADAASGAAAAGLSPTALPTAQSPGSIIQATSNAAPTTSLTGGTLNNLFGNSTMGQMMKQAGGIATGAGLGYALGPPKAAAPQLQTTAPGFSNHMPAVNSLGNYNQLLGNPNTPTTPTFAGLNPYAAATGTGYNFFPQS